MNLLPNSWTIAFDQRASAWNEIHNVGRTHPTLELLTTALLLAPVWFAAVPAYADQSSKPTLDRIIDSLSIVRGFDDVKISPDSLHVAWTSGHEIFLKD